MSNNFFPRRSYRLWENVEKYSRAGQATDNNTVHAQCMLMPKATNTHSQYVILMAILLQQWLHERASMLRCIYRGADKSLARPGRKQASVSVRMPWISFGALPCRKKTWWQLASRCCWNRARPWHASELSSFLVGLRTYQHPGTLPVSLRTMPVLVLKKKPVFPVASDFSEIEAYLL